jgi:preprotein translocase subunit SecD
MLDFPRWKVWSICLGLGLLMLLAVPSFIPKDMRATWPSWIPQPHINLGLDLAGGSHLLLEADVDGPEGLINQRIAQKSEEVSTAMRRHSPAIDIGDISTRDGKLSFMVRNVAQVDAAREQLLSITGSGVGTTGQREWDVQIVDGIRFVLTPTQAGLDQAVNQAMGDAREVIDKRLNAFGTLEPTIVREGTSRISVDVPGLKDPSAVKALIGRTAKLEFKMVVDANPDGTLPFGTQVLPNEEGGSTVVRRVPVLTGDQLVDASQGYDQQNGRPIVNFGFNSVGGKKFAKLTQENVGKRFAIVIDNKIISAPVINTPILGGSGYIQGNFTVDSANQLAIALRSGKLPVNLKFIQESTVSPELGADSIHAGLTASAIAAVAVIAFMILTYGRFGIYATIAVIINVTVILGIMALITGTLTLPGIAGFVLTVGTAVDANVLINERIREERRRGRSVIQAIELGYKEASRTIFEANVTHAIAGGIMLILGSGPIRGFAVVLLWGIATSVFTAVVFTRMLVAIWVRRNRPTEIHI